MTFEQVRLSDIIRGAIEQFEEAITERKMILTLRGIDDLPVIEADPKRLTQVFQNLISNGIKFTPDGGKIDVSGLVLGTGENGVPTSIQVIVADTGIGIDHDSMQLIFEKFFRVGPVELHSTGATKFKGAGPGLGLPIAKGIVEGHGGRIWVDSRGYDEEKLYGSAFNVVLPTHPPAKDLRNRIMELGSPTATRAGKSTDHFATRPGIKE
jgi:signal transduction histidine kinase